MANHLSIDDKGTIKNSKITVVTCIVRRHVYILLLLGVLFIAYKLVWKLEIVKDTKDKAGKSNDIHAIKGLATFNGINQVRTKKQCSKESVIG